MKGFYQRMITASTHADEIADGESAFPPDHWINLLVNRDVKESLYLGRMQVHCLGSIRCLCYAFPEPD